MNLHILICTHNRSELLERTLQYILQAVHPDDVHLHLLIIANACTDSTPHVVDAFKTSINNNHALSVKYIEESRQGKSYALNTGISEITSGYICFIDDDHRVDNNYFVSAIECIDNHNAYGILCGRILPDWDGTEPQWVHDEGHYRIYPLPVPRFAPEGNARALTMADRLPGGGNLIVDRDVFHRTGLFSTGLGPTGHNLGGGEDNDLLLRALQQGERLFYCPDIIQYHYVDSERLTLPYILKKSFQRSLSIVQVKKETAIRKVPLYIWRKLGIYFIKAVLSLSWARTRFYLVRFSSTLGEMQAYRKVSGKR